MNPRIFVSSWNPKSKKELRATELNGIIVCDCVYMFCDDEVEMLREESMNVRISFAEDVGDEMSLIHTLVATV